MTKIRINNRIDTEEQRISFWEDSSEEIAQNATETKKLNYIRLSDMEERMSNTCLTEAKVEKQRDTSI